MTADAASVPNAASAGPRSGTLMYADPTEVAGAPLPQTFSGNGPRLQPVWSVRTSRSWRPTAQGPAFLRILGCPPGAPDRRLREASPSMTPRRGCGALGALHRPVFALRVKSPALRLQRPASARKLVRPPQTGRACRAATAAVIGPAGSQIQDQPGFIPLALITVAAAGDRT